MPDATNPEGPLGCSTEQFSDAQLTLLCRRGFIGKRFFLDETGKVQKEAAGNFTDFNARRFNIGSAFLMKHLVEEMTPDMALVLGVAPHLPEQFTLSEGGPRRTRETFQFSPGAGWLLLDYDTDQMPDGVRQRIAELGGPLAAMEHIWPETRGACRVFKPSSSSGVYRSGDEPPVRFEGFHLYVLLKDQTQSADTLKALEARAWAEGLGWIKVSRSGSLLVRSIFDTTVGAPERLVFAGPPELAAGVARVVFPTEWQEGLLLEAPTFPEGVEWQRRIVEAKERLRPVAKQSEREWKKQQVRKSIGLGASAREATAAVNIRLTGSVLTDDTFLDLNDGSTIRVGDLLDQGPPATGKLSLPSPLDGIEYGRGKATLLWSKGSQPIIVDHAHGLRRRFTFARYKGATVVPETTRAFLSAPELSVSTRRQMTRLLQASDTSNARNRTIAVAKRLFWSVPAEWSLDDMLTWLQAQVSHVPFPPAFWHELQAHLETWMQARRMRATTTAAVRPTILKRHKVKHVNDLRAAVPYLPTGVLLVQAPLGSGKTQHIGAPLVALAKQMGLSVMAICHRITLTTELAFRLNLAHYQDATPEDIAKAGGVAVCLPSIKRAPFGASGASPDVIFLDEIRQVIDFLADTECFNADYASAEVIHDYLTLLIQRAQLIVGADAHLNDRTIEFLERCRPDEAFTIMVMSPTVRDGVVEFHHAAPKAVRATVVDAVVSELVAGGKVWLACESREFAEALDKHFEDLGFRSIAITARSKVGKAQAAFLKDADAESRNYDVVVSSPAISSGISIEHRDGKHFTLGVFIGSGHVILPTDAAQQIGRVRYLERIMVGVMTNNIHGRILSSTVLEGRCEALGLQETPFSPDDYARLAAEVAAEGRNARSDFAATLYWLLEREGWTIRLGGDVVGSAVAEEVRAAALREKLARLNATPLQTVAEVASQLDATKKKLEQRVPNEDDIRAQVAEHELRLEAARIRQCLGVTEILLEDYKLWDGGNLLSKIARFGSLVRDGVPSASNLRSPSFWLTDLSRARWHLYRELFQGFDVRAEDWLTPEVSDQVVDRLMRRPAVFAAVGIVGPKFFGTGRNASPKRPRSATKTVSEVLARVGLALRGKQRRVSQMGPVLVNTHGATCDRSRERVYTTVGFVEMMDMLRLQRLSFRSAGQLQLSIVQMRRSFPQLLTESQRILQQAVDQDDCHHEAYW